MAEPERDGAYLYSGDRTGVKVVHEPGDDGAACRDWPGTDFRELTGEEAIRRGLSVCSKCAGEVASPAEPAVDIEAIKDADPGEVP